MKKGVSPIVATVLLMTLTIALGALIYIWAQGMMKEQIEKYGKNADQACQDLSWDAEIEHLSANLFDLYITNKGNTPLQAIDVKKIGKGKALIDRRTISLGEGSSTKATLTLERNLYDTIFIIPVIVGNVRGQRDNRQYSCPQQYGKELKLP